MVRRYAGFSTARTRPNGGHICCNYIRATAQQLYKNLVKPIKASDESDAEPLSTEELRIIRKVAEKFPGEESVYEAAHREKVWQEAAMGSLIPYSCAYELTEI